MDFSARKAATLASLNTPNSTDKSPKGSLDTPIIPLINAINNHPHYYTTSSCSGRITIFSHKPNTLKGGSWLFISHQPLSSPHQILSLLFPPNGPEPTGSDYEPAELVFRFEPLIIAVECRDVEAAKSLVGLGVSCGFRESGITSVGKKRVIVAIRCSIRLEVPLGSEHRVLVSKEYVEFLVRVANEKMESNRKRTDGFLEVLRKNWFVECGGLLVVDGEKDGTECSEGDVCDASAAEDPELKRGDGLFGVAGNTLSALEIKIDGDPKERLFLWGHSACTITDTNQKNILVFGGFGGMGRHARRNDCLLLEPLTGKLEALSVKGAPCPRVGHTCSVIGDQLFVIGGRADPETILNDVWVFNTIKREWRLLECTGSAFPPRHRHAAAAVGSEIYVFGGLFNNSVLSSIHILDTTSLQWKEIPIGGSCPCARHSHSVVSYGSSIYMFGGFSGEKALDDLYSFNVQTRVWKKEYTVGRSPHARFSHSMFAYKKYIGIIGGCPVRQHYQELSLLDLDLLSWRHVRVDSVSKYMFVRSTACIVDDQLIMIGGGASCYAFGTTFSEPLEINLTQILLLDSDLKPSECEISYVSARCEEKTSSNKCLIQDLKHGTLQTSNGDHKLISENGTSGKAKEHQKVILHWVLQLEREYAKLGKDILKKFGWLDLGRKVYSKEGGKYICFPVTKSFHAVYCEKQPYSTDMAERIKDLAINNPEKVHLNEFSSSTALNLLEERGATEMADEVVATKSQTRSPIKIMNEAVATLLMHKGLELELLEQLPTRWERLGDIVVLPATSFKDPVWDSIGEELWPIIAKTLNAPRLARQGPVAATGTRDSTLEILVGDNGWVEHRENGIIYSFDATKCMFSWGNLSEKLRMARLHCSDEVIVDLFAGIGYFVLPFLVRANAELVYACEWNPHAIEALRHNIQANSVSDRCIVLEGDNRHTAPKGVANRVCLGLIPSSEGSWRTAVKALRFDGGILHIHGNVKDTEEDSWTEHVLSSVSEIASSEGLSWEVSLEHVERVKWYAPHIRHVVADVRCKQISR